MQDFSTLFACPLCASSNFKSLYEKSGADLVQCEECQLRFIPSPLPEVTNIYKANYLHGDQESLGFQSYGNDTVSLAMTYDRRLQDAEKYLGQKGRLLDLGCTLGLYGYSAQKSGWDVFVTDISEFAVMKAANDFQLKAFVSPIGKLPVRPSSFDFISAFEIIENTSLPMDLLQQMKSRLRPGGILHLTTPNIDSWLSRIMGKKWFYFKPEEHLIYFDPKTLRAAIEKAGFDVLTIRPCIKSMSLGELIMRFRPYAKRTGDLLLKVTKTLRVDRWIVNFGLGELEVFAKCRKAGQDQLISEKATTLEVLCCPKCEGDLKIKFPQVICDQCLASYEIESGVINFSKYAKSKIPI